jgi:hypothetical protein
LPPASRALRDQVENAKVGERDQHDHQSALLSRTRPSAEQVTCDSDGNQNHSTKINIEDVGWGR